MKLYKCDELEPVARSFKGVKSIVDTSGFMPLESKIKQFMLNGQIANLRSSLFDSYDFREMFNSIPEIVDDAFDDLEEVNAKLHAINAKRAEIMARKIGAKAPKKDAGASKGVVEGKNVAPPVKSSKKEELEE